MGEHMAVSQGRGGCPFAHAAQVLTPQSTWAALHVELQSAREAPTFEAGLATALLPFRVR